MNKNSSKHSDFLHFFPVPKFLQMSSVSLAISDSSVRFVGFKSLRRGPSLEIFGKKDLPLGVVERGYIHDQEKLVEVLSDIKKNYNLEFVKAVLPEDKVYIFRTEIPWIKKEEIRSALEFKIEENAPVNISEAVFDFKVLEENKNENKISLAVSVSSIKTVEAYLQSFKLAGLTPIALGVESQAICRSVVELYDYSTYLVVNVGNSQTGLFVLSQGSVQFTSAFHLSAEKLSEWSEDSFTVKLREEINKVIDYWQNHYLESVSDESKKIEKIIITGEVANLEGLASYLNNSDFFRKEVVLGNVWTNVFSLDKKIPPILFDQSLSFASAIGAGLPDDF